MAPHASTARALLRDNAIARAAAQARFAAEQKQHWAKQKAVAKSKALRAPSSGALAHDSVLHSVVRSLLLAPGGAEVRRQP